MDSVNKEKTEEFVFSLKRTEVRNVKFLGLQLDTRLTWWAHVDYLCAKLARNIFVLRQLSSSVSVEVLRSAYFSLCESHLRYGILVWGRCSGFGRIFRLQRRAIRIIANIGYRKNCRDYFRKLHILTPPSILVLELLMYARGRSCMWGFRGGDHSHSTRNRGDYCVPFCRLTKSYYCLRIWSV